MRLGANADAPSFNNFGLMLSDPNALFIFNFSRQFLVSASSTYKVSNVLLHKIGHSRGGTALLSSSVAASLEKLIKLLALSRSW